MTGEIYAREAQVYVGEHFTQWKGSSGKQWRRRWGLFVPVKKDGTIDKRHTPRASAQVLLEREDNLARLYVNNILNQERRDCPPGSWDIEGIYTP